MEPANATSMRIANRPPTMQMIVVARTSQRNPQMATATETAATSA
jgi:hypothetical protein